MSKDGIVMLAMSWVTLIILGGPGSIFLFIYYKIRGHPTFKAFCKGFTGWFYIFVILSGITFYNIVKYHPDFA